jgi:hypothetical protein
MWKCCRPEWGEGSGRKCSRAARASCLVDDKQADAGRLERAFLVFHGVGEGAHVFEIAVVSCGGGLDHAPEPLLTS